MGRIFIANTPFTVEWDKVVTWKDPGGFNAHLMRCQNPSQACPGGGRFPFSTKKPVTRTHRFSHRPQLRSFAKKTAPLSAVQGVVRQMILHHDGCPTAASCFNVLHNERGLSCHFLIDNDGTIFQTLDVSLMGWHAAGFNASSVGIELCNRGDAIRFPRYYNKAKGELKREKATCRIHNHVYLAYDYTKPQYDAMTALTRALSRGLPNMPIDYPQENPGQQAWGVITGARTFAGLMGHYHTTRRKWDPGPFDFKKFCEDSRGRLSFPVMLRGDQPHVPDDDTQRAEDVEKLFAKNEAREGGFYPVGPYGETRLWHGGVHLAGKVDDKLHVPFPGRVVAVRMGPDSPSVGSTNFLLIRHAIQLGAEAVTFYSLYFHVANEWDSDAETAPGWTKSKEWQANKAQGKVVLIDEALEAGDYIGRIAMAGPSDSRQAQVHFEMFATEEISPKLGVKFNLVDGAASGRFAPESLIKDIDKDKDGKLSRRELLDFFSSPDRKIARYYTTYHVSEWTKEPDWVSAVSRLPEFRGKKKKEVEELVAEQIEPTLWWDKRVAVHAKLPVEGLVFHYNPITLIKVINDEIQKAKVLGNVGKNAFKESEAKEKPDSVLEDIDDFEGETFVTDEEIEAKDTGSDLTLEDLANGFPDE